MPKRYTGERTAEALKEALVDVSGECWLWKGGVFVEKRVNGHVLMPQLPFYVVQEDGKRLDKYASRFFYRAEHPEEEIFNCSLVRYCESPLCVRHFRVGYRNGPRAPEVERG